MARLNEPPASSDSLDTLRRKMLRQNRELAKSNNIRALRIRELESECALMLSENLELRGRILELEKQVEDNEAQRIADHALDIKYKLEAQLAEWGTLLAGLGLEPPLKRHSHPPRMRKSMKQRMSFNPSRPSPSQRRLREIARDVAELGHISESRQYSRRSMNPEQIQALRSEADLIDDSQPETPSKNVESIVPESPQPEPQAAASPRRAIEPPVLLTSPRANRPPDTPVLSPEKRDAPDRAPKPRAQPGTPAPVQNSVPTKIGSKRKFAQDETERQVSAGNVAPRSVMDKASIRERAGGKTLKELAQIRKDVREKQSGHETPRKPLSAKNTNEDVGSPRKGTLKSLASDDVGAAKMKPRTKEQQRSKPGVTKAVVVPADVTARIKSKPTKNSLATPLPDTTLPSPHSADQSLETEEQRDDTPPPADITADGETARGSRRNRGTISYAEPNLRDKMRRPTQELYDAVTGEGRYARRTSQCEQLPSVKRESDASDSLRRIAMANTTSGTAEPGSIPASPLAKKASAKNIPPAKGHKRQSSSSRALEFAELCDDDDVDVYEFNSSSSQFEEEVEDSGKPTRRQGGRRRSAAVESDKAAAVKERSASRRRSMMV